MRVLFASPLGPLLLTFSARGLANAAFVAEGDAMPDDALRTLPPEAPPWMSLVLSSLEAFFSGEEPGADALPLDLRGTPFQRQVWQELLAIPRGSTVSYGELARRLGKPRAARAVGQAVGANPIPLLIPCHRVIAGNGALGGFSSGLERKRWLLEHEGVTMGRKGRT
jgi:methylated-DNA-[protein]-cysteine S-methyltransferase